MTELTTALGAVVAAHRALGSPIGDFLRPGLPAAVVVSSLDALGLPAPAEVVELYGWADGTDEAAWQATQGATPFLRFVGDAWFPPLDDAVRWCHAVRETAESLAWDSDGAVTADHFWHPTWFPVLRRNRGEFAVACLPAGPATVHVVDWEEPNPEPAFPDLTAFFHSMAVELRDRYEWLPDDRVLLSHAVADLRRSAP